MSVDGGFGGPRAREEAPLACFGPFLWTGHMFFKADAAGTRAGTVQFGIPALIGRQPKSDPKMYEQVAHQWAGLWSKQGAPLGRLALGKLSHFNEFFIASSFPGSEASWRFFFFVSTPLSRNGYG